MKNLPKKGGWSFKVLVQLALSLIMRRFYAIKKSSQQSVVFNQLIRMSSTESFLSIPQ